MTLDEMYRLFSDAASAEEARRSRVLRYFGPPQNRIEAELDDALNHKQDASGDRACGSQRV